MSEWWTYRPRDLLMFSPETYDRQFELLNEALWPGQVLALATGLAIVALMLGGSHWRGRAVAALLAAAWAFVAWAYFSERYAAINLAAPYYVWGFAAQALLLLASGTLLGRLTFGAPKEGPVERTGLALFAFALLGQPLIAPLAGRAWSGVELFGLAPDPTVLATLGVLLVTDRMRWELLVVPLLWCAITGITLWTMEAPEALLMLVLGGLTLVLATFRSLSGRSAES